MSNLTTVDRFDVVAGDNSLDAKKAFGVDSVSIVWMQCGCIRAIVRTGKDMDEQTNKIYAGEYDRLSSRLELSDPKTGFIKLHGPISFKTMPPNDDGHRLIGIISVDCSSGPHQEQVQRDAEALVRLIN